MGFYWDVKNTVGVLTKKERIWRVKQNISNFIDFLKNNFLLTTIWAVAVGVIVFFHFSLVSNFFYLANFVATFDVAYMPATIIIKSVHSFGVNFPINTKTKERMVNSNEKRNLRLKNGFVFVLLLIIGEPIEILVGVKYSKVLDIFFLFNF